MFCRPCPGTPAAAVARRHPLYSAFRLLLPSGSGRAARDPPCGHPCGSFIRLAAQLRYRRSGVVPLRLQSGRFTASCLQRPPCRVAGPPKHAQATVQPVSFRKARYLKLPVTWFWALRPGREPSGSPPGPPLLSSLFRETCRRAGELRFLCENSSSTSLMTAGPIFIRGCLGSTPRAGCVLMRF